MLLTIWLHLCAKVYKRYTFCQLHSFVIYSCCSTWSYLNSAVVRLNIKEEQMFSVQDIFIHPSIYFLYPLLPELRVTGSTFSVQRKCKRKKKKKVFLVKSRNIQKCLITINYNMVVPHVKKKKV